MPVTVAKIGRKYFYVDNDDRGYGVDDLLYKSKEYSQANRQLYISQQDIHDKNEVSRLSFELRNKFGNYNSPNLSLAQLRLIHNIINEKS